MKEVSVYDSMFSGHFVLSCISMFCVRTAQRSGIKVKGSQLASTRDTRLQRTRIWEDAVHDLIKLSTFILLILFFRAFMRAVDECAVKGDFLSIIFLPATRT